MSQVAEEVRGKVCRQMLGRLATSIAETVLGVGGLIILTTFTERTLIPFYLVLKPTCYSVPTATQRGWLGKSAMRIVRGMLPLGVGVPTNHTRHASK